MKTRFTASILLLIISALIWILYQHKRTETVSHLANTNFVSVVAQNYSPPAVVQTTGQDRIPTPEEFVATRPEREKARQILVENTLNAWRTPIEFYGRVVDESNNVVSGVQIDFSCNDLSKSGTTSYHTVSDWNGFFSLQNVTGKLLVLSIAKDGYYTSKSDNHSFEYGDSHITSYGKDNPIVFHLQKKREGVELTHYDKTFRLPRDGTPVLVDLATGSLTPSGQDTLKVEGQTHDNEKMEGWKYDWNCRVSVPGGGLQTYDEEFPFMAPESNYVSENVIDMPVTNDLQWSYIVHRNYYVHTGGGKYGRMVFTMVAGGDNFFEVNCFFNPSGSQNLEPK